MAEWIPKTTLGKKVLAGEITSFDQVAEQNLKILEPEIIDVLVPDLADEVLQITSTQRMTAYGRKQQMRAVVILGNKRGFIGVGVGKGAETRDAIAKAVRDSKMNLTRIQLGCGSWECGCGSEHSIPLTVKGFSGSTEITIKPAPRGVGVVAGETARKVLEMAGIKDCWTFSKGRTRNILNAVLATVHALNSLNKLKKGTEEKAGV
ncbi:MAG TPA: 30S ribosomal protein S5 [Candidatus Norongarragalinales archaeon]|nr:30S ribosomal protein S5 [Candidatus Norongarragalinales archaeon]